MADFEQLADENKVFVDEVFRQLHLLEVARPNKRYRDAEKQATVLAITEAHQASLLQAKREALNKMANRMGAVLAGNYIHDEELLGALQGVIDVELASLDGGGEQ